MTDLPGYAGLWVLRCKLWNLHPRPGREAVSVVEVVNATPEFDGSYRHNFLRVSPWAGSAREAVAWTFGLESADEYAPVEES